MNSLNLKFSHLIHSDEKLNSCILDILRSTSLFAMASVKGKESYVNTAYFSFDSHLNFYFISETDSQHAQNIHANSSVALAIYDSHQQWGGADKGLQVFGECIETEGSEVDEAVECYTLRFPAFWKFFQRAEDVREGAVNFMPLAGPLQSRILRFFTVKTKWLKLFDEINFGDSPFISLTPLR